VAWTVGPPKVTNPSTNGATGLDAAIYIDATNAAATTPTQPLTIDSE